MIRSFVIAAMSAAALCVSTAAPAQQTEGTAFEARAMLTKAVAAVKEDKTKALDMFNKGAGSGIGTLLFCHSISEAKLVATDNPNREQELGSGLKTGVDAGGKHFGAEIWAAYQKPEDQITEVDYLYPKPGADKTPVAKASFVTRVGDLGCGVGYYK
jgi:hypothetical protein